MIVYRHYNEVPVPPPPSGWHVAEPITETVTRYQGRTMSRRSK